MGSVCEPFYERKLCSDKGSIMSLRIVGVKFPRLLSHHMALIMLQSTISGNRFKLYFNPQFTPRIHGGKRNSKKFHVNKILVIFSLAAERSADIFLPQTSEYSVCNGSNIPPLSLACRLGYVKPLWQITVLKISRNADAMILEKCRIDFRMI